MSHIIQKSCEKISHWQRDRFYALQEEVLHQRPIAVMLTGILERNDLDKIIEQQSFRPLMEQQLDGKQINVMKLRDFGGTRKWIIFFHAPAPDWKPGPCFEPGESEPNWTYEVIFTFDDGPNTSKQAEEWNVQPYLLATNGPPKVPGISSHEITCWYEHKGTLYVYQRLHQRDRVETGIGFWKATAKDKAWLKTLRNIEKVDGQR